MDDKKVKSLKDTKSELIILKNLFFQMSVLLVYCKSKVALNNSIKAELFKATFFSLLEGQMEFDLEVTICFNLNVNGIFLSKCLKLLMNLLVSHICIGAMIMLERV